MVGMIMNEKDIERMNLLEDKRDACIATEQEEKELTYLIWRYCNQPDN